MTVILTDEQFKELLKTLVVSQVPAASQSAPAAVVTNTGNLSKCSTRFDGSQNNDVNAFIDAIEIFKDCSQVTDDNALKGIPMLLDGFAASWFQGVKATLGTWKEAIDLLRTTFGPVKPPHRVYRELCGRTKYVGKN